MRKLALFVAAAVGCSGGVALAAVRTDGSQPAPAGVSSKVTHVPVSTLNGVGAGAVSADSVKKLSGTPLQSGGKPEVLALTLAWCPDCAAISWSLAIALSRFGTFDGLRIINAGTFYEKHGGTPGYPNTHGISFFHSTFTSPYLQFVDVIAQDVNGKYLQRPTSSQQATFNSFDPHGIAPALDIAGDYSVIGRSYNVGLLGQKRWTTVARSLRHAGSQLPRRIVGYANLLTAAFCTATKGQPTTVCSSTGVKAAAALLPSS
jgi:hypothetical protein